PQGLPRQLRQPHHVASAGVGARTLERRGGGARRRADELPRHPAPQPRVVACADEGRDVLGGGPALAGTDGPFVGRVRSCGGSRRLVRRRGVVRAAREGPGAALPCGRAACARRPGRGPAGADGAVAMDDAGAPRGVRPIVRAMGVAPGLRAPLHQTPSELRHALHRGAPAAARAVRSPRQPRRPRARSPRGTIVSTNCTALVTLRMLRPDLRCVDYGADFYCRHAYYGDESVLAPLRATGVELVDSEPAVADPASARAEAV